MNCATRNDAIAVRLHLLVHCLHGVQVARSAAEARRELTSQHPDIRVDLVLQDSSSASHCTKRKGKALLPRP